MKIAALAITKNGIDIGMRLQEFPMDVYAPKKLHREHTSIHWYEDSARVMVGRLFTEYDALVCIFSLGAVVRLIAPHISDKKTDPAVLVVDDALTYVISVLSGHIGGANQLAGHIAERTGATPVITTAADVNKTIAVDLVGKDMGWVIEDDSTVTATSAHMVNGEPMGVYQDAGSEWWPGPLPGNITVFDTLDAMAASDCAAFLVISHRHAIPDNIRQRAVIYRPPCLVVGVGLHHTTTSSKIVEELKGCLVRYDLSLLCVTALASLKKPRMVAGLQEASAQLSIPVRYVERERLAKIDAPNPSGVVERFEGTPSVSEAAALLVSGGHIIVEKHKFPPDLTLAVAQIPYTVRRTQ